ncbi:MAG: hypothetical protein ABIB61_02505 [Candidatus Shapirobacteria bacterium]
MNKIILAFIFILGFGVRLYHLDTPLADWHSWRQVDTASVARFFVKDGYNLLKPRYHDLSKIASGIENPSGWRFVEFPIYNALHALFYQSASLVSSELISFDQAGRLVSIFSWLFAGLYLYLIVKKRGDKFMSYGTLFFFFFLPFNIYYSRTILPESLMLLLGLSAIYYFSKSKLLAGAILGSLALLVKPYIAFLLVPSVFVLAGQDYLRRKDKNTLIKYFFCLIGMAFPFLAWRSWMQHWPEGIPGTGWLLNKDNIRLRPAWWRWLFGERIGKLILGTWGIGIFVFGLIRKIEAKTVIFWAWLLGAFAYLVIFASGNVQHDYYQVLLSPTLAVFLGLGVSFLFSLPPKKTVNKYLLLLLVVFLTGLSLSLSWYTIKDYFSIIRPEIAMAGEKANELLPADAKVIAPYGGDTAFLYQTRRSGWPLITDSLKETWQRGATAYVAVDYNYITEGLIKFCKVLYEEPEKRFIIVSLTSCDWDKINF